MRVKFLDGMVVTAVAAATAVFLGAGGPLLRADGEGAARTLALLEAPAAELGGCELVAKAALEAGPSGQEAVVTIRATCLRSTAADLHLLLGAERRDLAPEAALRRVIRETDFVTTRVAEKEVRLAVKPGADAETSVRFGGLPAGAYTIAADLAGEDGKTVSLASVVVPEPQVAGKGR